MNEYFVTKIIFERQGRMYCLQWLIPVLLIPKPVNPALLQTHVMFMVLYLIGFFLERKPCTICSIVFLAAVPREDL
ncbi:bladder cancer-associated protein-like [Cephus cinctus]|uniref:Bladder cancer-associated protein-like n=1 Tax=Cephus cinctus TaxID=211228 RepID=A0AAJ7RUZ5_CEPCN|nr:bladder cancer-associated protein-like [Cephus cinctus]